MFHKLVQVVINGEARQFNATEIFDKDSNLTLAQFIAQTQTEIATMQTALAGVTGSKVVATIAARDALTGVKEGLLVWVKDASSDPTVNSGAACYLAEVANNTVTWSKVTEVESLDLVLSWGNLQDKPSSTVAEIDDAVAKKHEHANMATLSGIGTDGNGDLTFNNKTLNGQTGIAIGNSIATATNYNGTVQFILEDYDDSPSNGG